MTFLFFCTLAFATLIISVVAWDVLQKDKAILRNFPVIGHLRYWIQAIGPELRQYIVAGNDEERPFSRDERNWVYRSAEKRNNYFGFGTDNDLERSSSYLIIKQSSFPIKSPHPGEGDYDPNHSLPCAKILGGPRQRKHAFRPESLVYLSGMSFGSLSSAAVEALNRGSALAGCLHNTGEGGISPHHDHGGSLIWQIGTGYFGCRDTAGAFSWAGFEHTVQSHDVRAIEIKLSQGAKPGLGGLLPRTKITPEIARIRMISDDRDCVSPARHSAFTDADSLLDFVEEIADRTGLPVGIKTAVGQLDLFEDLAHLMQDQQRGIDFLTIDGGEGGTGAAPLAFSDHVALPFKIAFTRVYRIFARAGLLDRMVFIGSGKLGLPENALMALALGCDMIAAAREPLLAIGCIQAQRCHTGHCPTGVATQNRWLMRGLDPTNKAHRLANYVVALRKEILALTRACGHEHPSSLTASMIETLDGQLGSKTLAETFDYEGLQRDSRTDHLSSAVDPAARAAEEL